MIGLRRNGMITMSMQFFRRLAEFIITSLLLGSSQAATPTDIGADEAKRQILEQRFVAASFQMPISKDVRTANGFSYAAHWNPSSVAASSYTLHSGLDINTSNDCGRAVNSIGNGIVRAVGSGGSYWGSIILVQHVYWNSVSGAYAGVASQYAHVAPLDNLKAGDFVAAGQQLGYIAQGSVEKCDQFVGVSRPQDHIVKWPAHLHFELRTDLSLALDRWVNRTGYEQFSTCKKSYPDIRTAPADCRSAAADSAGYTSPEDWVGNHQSVAPPLPSAPTNLTFIQSTASSVDLAWADSGPAEIGYDIEWYNGTRWERIGKVGQDVTSFRAIGLKKGATYKLRALATNSTGKSPSNEVYFVAGAPPSAPSGLKATTAAKQVALAWVDNSNNESNFIVERRPVGSTIWSTAQITGANQTQYTDSNLPSGTGWGYRVSASNAFGIATSAPVEVTVPAPPPPVVKPNSPSGLTVAVVSKSRIDLTWVDNSPNETGFTVEQRQGSGNWGVAGSIAADVKSFSVTGLVANRAYGFRVFAFNSAGESAKTVEVKATTPK